MKPDIVDAGISAARARTAHYDAVIVGAGFAGIYTLYKLRSLGLSALVFEAGAGVGGTWFWNRYPGARCDVESFEYQFGFLDDLQRDWNWTERYSGQAEIMRYMDYVVDKLDLRRDMRFETKVVSAVYDESTRRWMIETNRNDRVSARYCIMATGCLSAAQVPNIPGLDDFAGEWFHTGAWPHREVDFSGKRVAVVGTGSSGVQAIPVIAETAAQLTVFQRTPNFSLPAFNRPLDGREVEEAKGHFAEDRKRAGLAANGALYPTNDVGVQEVPRERVYAELEKRWGSGGFGFLTTFGDIITDTTSNDIVADFVRAKIRAVIHDPEVADLLTPVDHPLGTKRICLDTGYFETFNKPHVKLVDVRRSPIERITPTGILAGAEEYGVDIIVFATGFDAMTGSLSRIDIRGRDGLELREKWEAGPRTYLGICSAGFPNFFMMTGPGSPSVLTNVVVSIEQHVDWLAECISFLESRNLTAIEALPEAEDAWVEHANEVAFKTLLPKANSWYLGANIPGKPRIFMPYAGGLGVYRAKCDEVALNGYSGFSLA